MNQNLTEELSIAATPLLPVSQGAATVLTGAIDMGKFNRAMFVLSVGVVGGGGTVDAKLTQAKTVGGAYIDVPSSAITQIVAGGQIVTIEVNARDLNSGYEFVKLSVTIAVANCVISAIGIGGEARYKPAQSNDDAAVTQRLVA